MAENLGIAPRDIGQIKSVFDSLPLETKVKFNGEFRRFMLSPEGVGLQMPATGSQALKVEVFLATFPPPLWHLDR